MSSPLPLVSRQETRAMSSHEVQSEPTKLPGFQRVQELLGPAVDLRQLAARIANREPGAEAALGAVIARSLVDGDRRVVRHG